MDWIVGLTKAATNARKGAPAEALAWASSDPAAFPSELLALYAHVDGGDFSGGVHLYGLDEVAAKSREPLEGTAYPGSVRLGHRGPHGQIFGATKESISPNHLAELPVWWDKVDEGAWVFGVRNDETGETRLYKSLEHLLSVLVPPAETEEFGERTYARAISLVQGALDSLKESAESVVEKAVEVKDSLEASGEKLAQTARTGIERISAKMGRKPKPAKKAAAPVAQKPARAKRAPAPKAARKAAAKVAAKPARAVKKTAAAKKSPAKRAVPSKKASAKATRRAPAPSKRAAPAKRPAAKKAATPSKKSAGSSKRPSRK